MIEELSMMEDTRYIPSIKWSKDCAPIHGGGIHQRRRNRDSLLSKTLNESIVFGCFYMVIHKIEAGVNPMPDDMKLLFL